MKVTFPVSETVPACGSAGGDDTVVPDRNCYGNVDGTIETEMPTDLYYSGLGGSWPTRRGCAVSRRAG